MILGVLRASPSSSISVLRGAPCSPALDVCFTRSESGVNALEEASAEMAPKLPACQRRRQFCTRQTFKSRLERVAAGRKAGAFKPAEHA